jgi:SsrA-binding protein
MSKSTPKQPRSIQNKKASHRFEFIDRYECGIMLTGTEVKSLRTGKASLDEAYARVEDGELWLIGMNISTYEHGNVQNHAPLRQRKLLLHRREIDKLLPKVQQQGLTLVPTKVYFNDRGLAKCEIALAKGKATHDKREDLKKREHTREMERAMRRNR